MIHFGNSSLHIFRSGDSIRAGLYVKLSPKCNEILKIVEPVGISFFSTFGPESPEVGSVYPSSQPVQCQKPDHEYFEYSRWPDHAAHVVFDIGVTKRMGKFFLLLTGSCLGFPNHC